MENQQAMTALTSLIASLGVGGALAALMFIFYRRDSHDNATKWQGVADQLLTVVKENTRVNTELVTLIRERLPHGER